MTARCLVAAAFLWGLGSCGSSSPAPPPPPSGCAEAGFQLERVFPTSENPRVEFEGCVFASPLAFESSDGARVIATEAGGTITSLDAVTGQIDWQIELPVGDGFKPVPTATPAIVGDRLIVEYHDEPEDGGARASHQVVVLNLETGALDNAFAALEVQATKLGVDGDVEFQAQYALERGAIAHATRAGSTLGYAYLTYGNIRDIQPWHGWAFELDLDAWAASGPDAAISGVLLTTPEIECGEPGHSGSRERVCGGGIWGPAGPLIVARGDSYDIVVSTGNGQLDLARGDYANTLIRTGPGLAFDPNCDADRCADFDPDDPSLACVESCENLFIPRLLEGQTFAPENGACDGLTLFQCWEELDYIGGSTPVDVDVGGEHYLAYPAKDGHLYLVDADHLGTMLDREKVVDVCGTPDDRCAKSWAGMIVTQPALTELDGVPVVIVPSFMPDETHPAGVVAFDVVATEAGAEYRRRWEFPPFDEPEALEQFREHPSRVAVTEHDGGEVAWVVDVERGRGTLWGICVEDGGLVAQHQLTGNGQRYGLPLQVDDMMYVASCESNDGPGWIEGYRIVE